MTPRSISLLGTLLVFAAPAAAHAEEDPWLGKDKALHFGATAALSAGGYGIASTFAPERWQRATLGAALGLGAGAAKEFADLAGYGHPSWRDVTWDVIGTATGVALALAIDLAIPRKKEQSAATRGSALIIRF